MIIVFGKVDEKCGWFDNVDDWFKCDCFVFVGWFGILLFLCVYFVFGGWFIGIIFVLLWYIYGFVSLYFEGCNFFILVVLILFNSMVYLFFFFWGLEV